MMTGKILSVSLMSLLTIQFSGYGQDAASGAAMLDVSSGAFKDGDQMPLRHGYRNENLSPAISWSGVPAQAKSIAMICDDPDAPGGDWVHWVIFNIPATASGLPEGVKHGDRLPDGAIQGTNDFHKVGYDGPAPPSGVHRYYFKVYALDSMLDLKPRATKKELLRAMSGHILGEGSVMGRFRR